MKAQCFARPLVAPHHAFVPSACPQLEEAQGIPSLAGVPATEKPRYCLRLAEQGGTPCALCREATGSGVVGYLAEDPVCDLCLLEGSSELGMVLALICVTRAYGALPLAAGEGAREALIELGAFARIYERFAARFGPARFFKIPLSGAAGGPRSEPPE